MKKIFALALAAVMAAGMTTVAFADDLTELGISFNNDGHVTVYADTNDNGVFGETADKTSASSVAAPIGVTGVDGGVKIAIPLIKGQALDAFVANKDDIKGVKVSADWTVGKLDDKAAIEFVKIDGKGYVYCVTLTLPENDGTKKADLQGTVTLYTNSSEKKNPENFAEIDINFEYGYDTQELSVWESDMTKAEIVDFSNEEDEITMDFGDLFSFEVNVTGQKKLNLVNNTDYDPEFGDKYSYANIDFVTFEKEPTFNKIGTAYIYADEDAFIYEVTADGAKAINGLKWDEDYEAWTFKTRKLTSYAISDVELDEQTVTEDKADESSKTEDNTGKPNPDTGR